MKFALAILFTLLTCATAYAHESPANWNLLDAPTASVSYERGDTGTLSLSRGTDSVRVESFAKYRKFDHTDVGMTVEATFAHRFVNFDRTSALFASPRLTITHDLGTGLVGGETAMRMGFATPRDPAHSGWGYLYMEIVKVTNAQWEFRFSGDVWSYIDDSSVEFGGTVSLIDYEGHSGPHRTTAGGSLGVRLRVPIFEFGLTLTAGFDWVIGGGREWYDASDGGKGALANWFFVFEWRG